MSLLDYDESQLMEGLRKADKAGDTAAAKRFAEAIQQKRDEGAGNPAPVPQSVETPQEVVTTTSTGSAGDRWANLASDVQTGNYDSSQFSGEVEHGSGAHAVGDAMLQGATFGFSDEMLALLRSTMGGETYEQARDKLRADSSQLKEEHPLTYLGGEVAGAIPTAIALPTATWQRGGSMLRNLGLLGAEGAAYGALSGLGTSEGETVGDIALDTAKGGALGAVFGSAFGGLSEGARKLLNGDRVQSFLESTKGGQKALKALADDKRREAEAVLRDLSPDNMGSADQVGKAYREGFEQWDKDKKEHFDEAFDYVYQMVNMQGETLPTNSISVLRDMSGISGTNQALANLTESSIVRQLRKALGDDTGTLRFNVENNRVSVEALKELRTRVGEATRSGKIGDQDIDTNQARRLYGALSQDLDSAVEQHANNPHALKFYNTVNERYARYKAEGDALANLFGTRGGTPKTDSQVGTDLANLLSRDASRLEPLVDLNVGTDAGRGILNQAAHNQGYLSPERAAMRGNLADLRYSEADRLIKALTGEDGLDALRSVKQLEDEAQSIGTRITSLANEPDSVAPLALSSSIGAGLGTLAGNPVLGAAIGAGLPSLANNVSQKFVKAANTNPAIKNILDKPLSALTNDELRVVLEIMASDTSN